MAFNVVQNYVITNQPMTVSIGETSTVSVIVTRETGAILCRIAVWDSFGQETGSKFDTTSTRSQA